MLCGLRKEGRDSWQADLMKLFAKTIAVGIIVRYFVVLRLCMTRTSLRAHTGSSLLRLPFCMCPTSGSSLEQLPESPWALLSGTELLFSLTHCGHYAPAHLAQKRACFSLSSYPGSFGTGWCLHFPRCFHARHTPLLTIFTCHLYSSTSGQGKPHIDTHTLSFSLSLSHSHSHSVVCFWS